jgi:hypothetical protein
MSASRTIVIGAPDLLASLREHVGGTGEVLTLSDRDPLAALEAVVAARPAVVAFERLFAATSRGAALINRIKSDPALTAVEVRVMSHDGQYVRVSPRPRAVTVTVAPPQALDYRGTRQAPRVRIVAGTDVLVDDTPAHLVDLSAVGAQVISPAALRPNQRVRMTMGDNLGVVHCRAAVAWASFEMATSPPRYRAGIAFTDANGAAVMAFGQRHRQAAPPSPGSS